MSVTSKSRPFRKNSVILDLFDDISDFFYYWWGGDDSSENLQFLRPMRTLKQYIEQNSRNSRDLWTNMETVTLMRTLQKKMWVLFDNLFGDEDPKHHMLLKEALDDLSERLTVVYTDMMNDLNHKAQSRLSHSSINDLPILVMDTIAQRKYTKNDHSGLRVLLTQLKTVPLGARHSNRNRNGLPDFPEPDQGHYEDPDDNAVDENTANLTGIELELMRPSLIHAIALLRRYDYRMFPDLESLHLTDRALARSMASVRREKYQLTLAALSTHDYNAARRHLRHIVQYLPRPVDNTARRNLQYMPRPAARRTH
jgi:hypothetical protein